MKKEVQRCNLENRKNKITLAKHNIFGRDKNPCVLKDIP
jgi:hypothetical protein